MDEYDSGDDLLEDINPDELSGGKKRPFNETEPSSKRVKVSDTSSVDANNVALARSILRQKFGYENFRHEQEKAIASILRGENTLVVFPTGAGKSLCYQIPGIAFEENDKQSGERSQQGSGITLVVSPLIALMKDQTDVLKRKGIAADCSDSSKTYAENQQIHTEIREGCLRLLYCSPEKLNNESFVQSMKYVPGGIRLVAVDEAHCISEWGHSFRPDYLKVARFAEEINAERVICLTATATPRVAEDICKAFKVDKSNVFRTSPYRPNLQLQAESTQTKQDKYPKLFQFLRQHTGATLVYVTLQKQAEALAADLAKEGFKATAFHAGMRTEQKTKIQDDFMSSKIPIVVATIAFGMGIDKANIRNIVHWGIPATIEEYSQQIGRAGRDGLPSHCMLYICPEDFYIRENFARGDLPSRESIRGLLKDIFSREATEAPEGDVLKFGHYDLAREFDIRTSPLGILFATLELRFGLLRAITPEYTNWQFEDIGTYKHVAAKDKSPEGEAIYKQAMKKKKYYSFDPNDAIAGTNLLRADVLRKLDDWHNRGIVMVKASGVQNRYRILKKLPTTDSEVNGLAEKLYIDMETREQDALQRVQDVANMITGDKCFALALAEHFGMHLPGGKESCGHCTYCQNGKAVVMPPKATPPVDFAGIQKILNACDVRDDARFLARIAFGIKSPRVTQLKMDKDKIFGSLEDHDFTSLLREFEHACKSYKYGAGNKKR
ncbi:ATP-dependent DNA helicase recQ [Xylariales sp. AK1849]|nr:ATP-dependent DNA helicase recQ [Xylariales sp. AK1849]